MIEEIRSGMLSLRQSIQKHQVPGSVLQKWNRWYFKIRLLKYYRPKSSFLMKPSPPTNEQLKLQLQEDFELIGYYLEGELLGFNTTLYWDNNCEAHSIGMNYDFNAPYALYQNMLYDQVRSAITKKKSKLILGRTAMEMKSNFGAEPYEMCCYVRHSGQLINKALKPVFNYIKQTEWTQRRPFKESLAPSPAENVVIA